MLNILAIGNSFSQDATRFLHQTAAASGIDTKVVNLYIGACSLERHWGNIESGKREYQYQLNGMITERQVSIEEVLSEEKWDYIITQQVSQSSGWADTYEPFLGLMTGYLKEKAPDTELLLHETWAYEEDSQHPGFVRYNRSQKEMFERLNSCYSRMADKYGLRLIPSGEIIQSIRSKPKFSVNEGGLSLCRDGFHMSLLYGRYLLACIWLKYLTGIKVIDNTYVPETVESADKADIGLIMTLREYVDEWFGIPERSM